MKALASRIDRLYADELKRWREAWQRFSQRLMSYMTHDERQAYSDYHYSDHPEAVEALICGWVDELRAEFHGGKPVSTEGQAQAEAFFNAFIEIYNTHKEEGLSCWPEDVPFPPDEDVEAAQREEEAMLRLCRREKKKGDAERFSAALLVFHVAVCRTARIYSREGKQR